QTCALPIYRLARVGRRRRPLRPQADGGQVARRRRGDGRPDGLLAERRGARPDTPRAGARDGGRVGGVLARRRLGAARTARLRDGPDADGTVGRHLRGPDRGRLPRVPRRRTHVLLRHGRAARAQWRAVLRAPGVPLAYLLRFTAWLGRTMIMPYLPLFIATLTLRDEFTSIYTGVAIGAASFAGTISGVALGRLGDRVGHKRVLV